MLVNSVRKPKLPGRRTVKHQRSIRALKIIKPRHHTYTPGHKRRGVLSTFYNPCPLKLRNLDPQAIEKLKGNIVRVNKRLPFQNMNPNASEIVLVNSLIEIAAKGFALQMKMKDFTHICFFYRQQYIYFCSPTKSMFNKYNSVSSQFNNHSQQYTQTIVDVTTNQFHDLMCQKNTILSH